MSNPDKISVAAASDAARFANSDRTEQPVVRESAHTAAAQDAARLAASGEPAQLRTTPTVDLSGITNAEARIITSEEHKALGYKPPQGSLAAQAQSAAAHHEQEDSEGAAERGTQRTSALKEAARMDAARIAAQKGDGVGSFPTVDLDDISKEEEARLQSAEHQILGYRPPPGSLAAQAQSAADMNATSGNRINGEGPGGVNLDSLSKGDVSRLMSEEHRRLGHPPPAGTLASQAQSAVDTRPS